ncbi:hypothetical protein, partial [Leuconostoc mesenteroides]|uniref:hypothetical protein n=1 Tax=Leuconostoc mesenteroides TaxID=1245 RepID=UPI001CBD0C1A
MQPPFTAISTIQKTQPDLLRGDIKIGIDDFGQYHEGDEVTLYTDDVPLLKFRIHAFKPDQTTLPDKLFDV